MKKRICVIKKREILYKGKQFDNKTSKTKGNNYGI